VVEQMAPHGVVSVTGAQNRPLGRPARGMQPG
jgi:hypothetical protein